MPLVKYRIYELSARAVISYGRKQDGTYTFHLSAAETERCKSLSAPHEQDDNALFYQIMCVLHGDAFTGAPGGQLVTDLSDIIFYMDFSGIFDRSGARKKHLIRQEKAKALFRPEGVSLDFGSGPHRYLAFERSGSMSRQARLAFIREDFYDTVCRRIMMDMTLGDCQLSKLYAYNGLMLSSGIRIDGIGIDRPHRVVVIDNPTRTERNVSVITVEDDGTQSSTRKYHRVEKKEDIEITCFDGEGLISKEYARDVDEKLCGKKVHTSFQIRMPYVKGMLHEVDFKDFLTLCGTDTITDLWGMEHSVRDVDVILTKSMFKGYGWLNGSGMSWEDYWAVFRKYRHALYITNVSKEKPEKTTELNYQFLTTVSIQGDEFRPADLPDGWDHSPETDERNWLTKQTELRYYNLCANPQFRQNYFLEKADRISWWERHQGKDQILAAVLKKNPRFINEPVYARRLEDEADKIVEQYAVGRLIVAGDNRYLSGDLLDFLAFLLPTVPPRKRRQRMFYSTVMTDHFPESSFYAPQAAYAHDDACTLLRNPHIARNEELQLSFYDAKEERKQMRHYYFGHLTDVVMVDSNMLAAERLGGADYDGDMIKTISDPILNACVRRNYNLYRYEKHKSLTNTENIPLLMIPTAQPQIRNADDWEARFETVRSTFSSRVGQICNAALDRSIIAYNENSNAEERERCREETETLAILTGLEIDSAKSGIRPDLDEYLTHKTVKRSDFLKYKTLVEEMETRRTWYEPTHAARVKAFFKKVDWSKVDSNVERLPYLAQQLKKITPRIKAKSARDEELFSFAQQPDWREQLNSDKLAAVDALLRDHDACLSRIRACRIPVKEKKRKSDVERILYARGQEDEYDPDELYALFGSLPSERVSALQHAIREQAWHLMDEDARERFLREWLPEFEDIYDLLTDFRFGGYRILGDIVCDMEDENTGREKKQLFRESDSKAFTAMMRAFADKSASRSYRDAVTAKCRELLTTIVRPTLAVRYVVALGRRDLLWELLPEYIEKNVLEVWDD
ncbi:RNA dependent RNA polymerase [Dysosmobacter welbionis]